MWAGINDVVEEAKNTHAAEIKQLEKDKKDAIAQRDLEFAAQLEEERKDHLAKVKQLEEGKKLLAQPVPRSGPGHFGRWVARTTALAVGGAVTLWIGGVLAG